MAKLVAVKPKEILTISIADHKPMLTHTYIYFSIEYIINIVNIHDLKGHLSSMNVFRIVPLLLFLYTNL